MLKIKNKKGETIATLEDDDSEPQFIKDKEEKNKHIDLPDNIELKMVLTKEGEFRKKDKDEDTEDEREDEGEEV